MLSTSASTCSRLLKKNQYSTRPAPARQDAPFHDFRSGFVKILNGATAASLTRQRAQTWCSLFVAPCAPEGTPPVSTRLRPRRMAFLSSLLYLTQAISTYLLGSVAASDATDGHAPQSGSGGRSRRRVMTRPVLSTLVPDSGGVPWLLSRMLRAWAWLSIGLPLSLLFLRQIVF
jgi:hypothetical protein